VNSPGADPSRLLVRVGLLALGLLWLSGCASVGRVPDPVSPNPDSVDLEVQPWEIPPEEWRTQRILRLHYDGPEGNGTLFLVLRLESPERFHVTASDRLGRRWWELNVREDSALVLWARERTFCRYRGDLEIPALSLGPVPAGAVAALLLRRLPSPPAAGGEARAVELASSGAVEFDFRDRLGRRWTALSAADGPIRWALRRGGEVQASWRADAATGLARLEEAATGLELRWQQRRQARDLAAPIPEPSVPVGFAPGVCGPGTG